MKLHVHVYRKSLFKKKNFTLKQTDAERPLETESQVAEILGSLPALKRHGGCTVWICAEDLAPSSQQSVC